MRRWLRDKIAEQITAHLTDDTSMEGWLDEAGSDGFLLRSVRLHLESGIVPLEGWVWVARERVRFIQAGGVR